MPDEIDPMAGVTDEIVTLQITARQYAQLEKDRVYPGRARVSHTVGIGDFVVPGRWVVVATQKNTLAGGYHSVTLAKLED